MNQIDKRPPAYQASQSKQVFMICDNMFDYNRTVFTSEKSMLMYKENKKLKKSDPAFTNAKHLQNMTIGMPLMFSHRMSYLGIGEFNFLRLFACIPSPEANDRLFDKLDKRHFADVMKKRFGTYYRFRLLVPENEIIIILHKRLSYADYQIDNDRFRFVKSIGSFSNVSYFSYDLYILSPKQSSLIDELGPGEKVSKNNELLGNRFLNLLPVKFCSNDRSTYTSDTKLGTFEYKKSRVSFSRTRKISTFSTLVEAMTDQDSNAGVTLRNRIHLAVVCILQAYEDDLALKRGTNNVGY